MLKKITWIKTFIEENNLFYLSVLVNMKSLCLSFLFFKLVFPIAFEIDGIDHD